MNQNDKTITTCCICGGSTKNVANIPFLEVYGMAKDYVQRINICPECGFIFTANPFTEEMFANRYKKMSKYEFDDSILITEERQDYVKRSKRQYDFIHNNIGQEFNSILEVGASSGYNLSLYKKNGIEVYGIEPSEVNTKSCKQNYDIDLFPGMFQEYANTHHTKNYDMIFLSHVLEHIVNPSQFIAELSKINNKYIFVEVPSFDYKFIDEPFGMFTDEHVNYFTLESLKNILANAGYDIVDAALNFSLRDDVPSGNPCLSAIFSKTVTDVWGGLCVCGGGGGGGGDDKSLTIAKKQIFTVEEIFKQYLQKSELLQQEINQEVGKLVGRKLAVWGTGNTSSRLIANSPLKIMPIVKFYDSDLRKKDTVFFGKKVVPFSSVDIEKGEIDTILIASYVYQEAIYSAIKQSRVHCDVVRLF